MARVKLEGVTMLIYEGDRDLIKTLTLNHRNIETGGDLFGLWQNENEVVVQVVSGPGRSCRRTTTSFFQDKTYLGDVGNYLTSSKGLCNIGEWHSHHSLNLPEPSGGDRATVWRNMPGYGLKRFLLVIATIKPEGNAEMNGFMFTSPEHGNRQGQMIHVQRKILPGPNPFRNQPDVLAKLHEGAEIPRVEIMAAPEKGGRKKQQKKIDKEDRKRNAKAENEKRKQQENAKKERKESQQKGNKKKGRIFKTFGFKRRNRYNSIPDNGGTSGVFYRDIQSGSMTDMATASQSTNIFYQGGHTTPYPQEVQQTSRCSEISSSGHVQPSATNRIATYI